MTRAARRGNGRHLAARPPNPPPHEQLPIPLPASCHPDPSCRPTPQSLGEALPDALVRDLIRELHLASRRELEVVEPVEGAGHHDADRGRRRQPFLDGQRRLVVVEHQAADAIRDGDFVRHAAGVGPEVAAPCLPRTGVAQGLAIRRGRRRGGCHSAQSPHSTRCAAAADRELVRASQTAIVTKERP